MDISSFKKQVPAQKTTGLKTTQAEKDGSMLAFDAWAKVNGIVGDAKVISNADNDGDGLSNALEYVHATDPNNQDTDRDKFSDKQEIINGYDPDDTGNTRLIVEVSIEKLGVSAPIVWSAVEDEKAMLKDLDNGVIHFPKSASPGQKGNMVISGHSSNYVWSKGSYNYVFRDLNELEKGDVVKFKTIQKNGKVISYTYVVEDKYITAPDDERIFEDTQHPSVTLSTCWPLGTNFKRLIVKAILKA